MNIAVIKDIERDWNQATCSSYWPTCCWHAGFEWMSRGDQFSWFWQTAHSYRLYKPRKRLQLWFLVLTNQAWRSWALDSWCPMSASLLSKAESCSCWEGVLQKQWALWLTGYAWTLSGMRSYCVCAFTDVVAVISSMLAKTAGLNPISTVTEQKTSEKQVCPRRKL